MGDRGLMAGRGRRSRCSLQRRPRRDGEEAHLGLGELRAPQVGSNWLYELSAPISLQKANWIPRAGPGSKAGVALSAPLERLLEPGELRVREKDHANVTVTSTLQQQKQLSSETARRAVSNPRRSIEDAYLKPLHHPGKLALLDPGSGYINGFTMRDRDRLERACVKFACRTTGWFFGGR